MGRWKAGPEKPRTKFCWNCSGRFHGRVHARVLVDDREHDLHKTCLAYVLALHPGATVVYRSSTTKGESKEGREG